MAQYEVEHICGHKQTHALFGPHRGRQSKIEWLEGTDCYDCYRAAKAAKHAAEAVVATATAQEYDMPALTGSEKQVPWAETIRVNWLKGFEDETPRNSQPAWHYQWRTILHSDPHVVDATGEWVKATGIKPNLEASLCAVRETLTQDVYAWAAGQTNAHWWIDNREDLTMLAGKVFCERAWSVIRAQAEGRPVHEVVMEYQAQVDADRLAVQQEAEAKREAARLRAEAAAEATVRPTELKTTALAEITYADGRVTVRNDRDDLIFAVVSRLDYQWDKASKLWARDDTADLAAETGHRLLSRGVSVRIYDPELRRRAIAGEYKPYNPKMVKRLIGKEIFILHWPRAIDIYTEVSRISGARWNKKLAGLTVPAKSYEEVEDLAGVHGFDISPCAMELICEQRDMIDRSLTVEVEPLPDDGQAVAFEVAKLDVPTDVDVPAELLDEEE